MLPLSFISLCPENSHLSFETEVRHCLALGTTLSSTLYLEYAALGALGSAVPRQLYWQSEFLNALVSFSVWPTLHWVPVHSRCPFVARSGWLALDIESSKQSWVLLTSHPSKHLSFSPSSYNHHLRQGLPSASFTDEDRAAPDDEVACPGSPSEHIWSSQADSGVMLLTTRPHKAFRALEYGYTSASSLQARKMTFNGKTLKKKMAIEMTNTVITVTLVASVSLLATRASFLVAWGGSWGHRGGAICLLFQRGNLLHGKLQSTLSVYSAPRPVPAPGWMWQVHHAALGWGEVSV